MGVVCQHNEQPSPQTMENLSDVFSEDECTLLVAAGAATDSTGATANSTWALSTDIIGRTVLPALNGPFSFL
jgi:hypothetical protein